MKILFWLVVIVLAAALASFAASNREAVSLGLWPLAYVAQLPLYLAVLAALVVGFGVGFVAAWIAGSRRRREARLRRRRIRALELELAATRAQLPASSDPVPALPVRG